MNKDDLMFVANELVEGLGTNDFKRSSSANTFGRAFRLILLHKYSPNNILCVIDDIKDGCIFYNEMEEDGKINPLLMITPLALVQFIREVKMENVK